MNLFQKFTLRIVLFCFLKKNKELNSFLFDVTQRIELFFSLTQRIVSFLRNITRWIESFFQYYSKTWAFFSHNTTFKNWTFLKNMTQRIELFKCDLEPRIILQFDSNNWIWLKALNPPFQYDSKNWTLLWTWLTETYWVIITQRIVLSKNMTHKTQRIEPSFHKWLEDLTFLFQICLIEITFFFFLKKRWLEELIFWKYQSNYTNFILMTQRIELFFFEKHDS